MPMPSNPALLLCRGLLVHAPQQHPQLPLVKVSWGEVSVTTCLCSQAIKAPKCSVLSLQEVETHELVFLWTLTPLAILKKHWDDSALHKHKSRKKRLIFLWFRGFWFVCFFGWTLGFFGWFFLGVGSWVFCV